MFYYNAAYCNNALDIAILKEQGTHQRNYEKMSTV